jgi:amino acid adenylation domain-containing protein
VGDSPDVPLETLSFLAPGESGRLLAAWNEPSRDDADSQPAAIDRRPVVQRIDAVCRAVPDRVAIEMRATTPGARVRPGRLVSYRALRRRVAAIAAALRDRELPAESLIAVALDREADFLSACLAIWQLGHAVLPLDPAHPPARIDAILGDSDAALLLHAPSPDAREHRGAAGARSQDRSPALPTLDLRTVPQSAPPRAGRALVPESLAYVLYTSGSTGRPKGVQISHGALASFLGAIEARLPLSPGDELLALTTFMFDISFLEVLLPLVRGATTVLLEHDSTVDPRRLAAAIDGGRTRMVQATPSHWRMLVDSGWRGGDDLVIACGGERLDSDLSAALVERSRELWNLYGPTEATIWSSSYRVRAPGRGASEPIGTPLPNTRLYLLDGRLAPVRPGAAGELYIGGEALARGYRAQRALTAERFIPDPWSAVPGARMYRTGDVVAFSPAAGIRFLRRQDDQVKVRGHRIELAEIEQAARQHPAVADAIAVVQETGSASGAGLALHVLLRESIPPQQEDPAATAAVLREVRDRLRQGLPDYMVPPLMARLDAVPLTPNGKKDRARLTSIERPTTRPVPAGRSRSPSPSSSGRSGRRSSLGRARTPRPASSSWAAIPSRRRVSSI